MARFNVPCNGGNSDFKIPKNADTITIGTSGNCTFVDFQFTPTDPAPGFSNKSFASDMSTVSFHYDGSTIPPSGDAFSYETTSRARGNGTGKISNE